MANKRDYNLDSATVADGTYSIKTDKLGLTEAQQITIAELKTLMGVINSEVTTLTITCTSSSATINNISAKKVDIGDMTIYNIEFDYSGTGETDPIFSLGEGTASRPFLELPVNCQVEVAGTISSAVSYMTSSTPDYVTVLGDYQTATFRMSISIVNS